jgi:hypothetical protein
MKDTVTPAVEVVVREGERPAEGAAVTLTRYEYYPHFRPDTARPVATTTDAGGHATFPAETEYAWHMPLMRHGVPGYGWQLCVEHAGYKAVAQRVGAGPRELPEPERVSIALEAGTGPPCAELVGVSRDLPATAD